MVTFICLIYLLNYRRIKHSTLRLISTVIALFENKSKVEATNGDDNVYQNLHSVLALATHILASALRVFRALYMH